MKGSSVGTIQLGSWKAGLDSELSLNNEEDMRNYTAAIVHRVATVEVIN